jgi:hypothetical protein
VSLSPEILAAREKVAESSMMMKKKKQDSIDRENRAWKKKEEMIFLGIEA